MVGDISSCPECGGGIVHDDKRAEASCKGCGLIVADGFFDPTGGEKTIDKYGMPTTHRSRVDASRADSGLGSVISYGYRDGKGRPLSVGRQQLFRMKQQHFRSMIGEPRDKTLARAFSIIKSRAAANDLPSTVSERAIMIMRQTSAANAVKGRALEETAAACVYTASRERRSPLLPEEVAEMFGVSRRAVMKAYTHITRNVGIKPRLESYTDYLGRFCNTLPEWLGVDRLKLETTALELGKALPPNTRSPSVIAAGLIYASGLENGYDLTQEDVGRVAGVSMVSIRNTLRYIAKVTGKSDLRDRAVAHRMPRSPERTLARIAAGEKPRRPKTTEDRGYHNRQRVQNTCETLGLPSDLSGIVLERYDALYDESRRLGGGKIASLVFLTAREVGYELTPNQAARAAGVSPSNIVYSKQSVMDRMKALSLSTTDRPLRKP